MKFRPQGNKVQALAYMGYDNVKKKSIVQMVATYNPETLEVAYVKEANGEDRANSVMKNEVTEHLKNIKESREIEGIEGKFTLAMSFLSDSGMLIEKNPEFAEKFSEGAKKYSEEKISAVWRALQSLEKALEANGHQRPKRQYKKPADQKDPRQVDLLAKS